MPSTPLTHGVPRTLPLWRTLTSLNVYSYYRTEHVEEGQVLGATMHPTGATHFSIYATHSEERRGERPDLDHLDG